MHLTMWSWILHILYFEVPLMMMMPQRNTRSSSNNNNKNGDYFLLPWIHGPSLGGSIALLLMYIWTLIANPSMEFDLAPPGRSTWFVYLRAFWFHVIPVYFHRTDIIKYRSSLKGQYNTMMASSTSTSTSFKYRFFKVWVSVGGYIGMGLTWEQLAGDTAAGVYNVTIVTPETFTLVSKVLGIIGCLLAYKFVIGPLCCVEK